jgi:hypothetical protein
MSTEKKTIPGKVITGKVRFSYAHVFRPAAVEGSTEEKYSCSLLIPKKDKATIEAIKNAIAEVKKGAMAVKFGGKVVEANFHMPLRDGDDERPDDEAYAGCMFVNANAKTKPEVVGPDLQPIMSEDEFYSGCFGRASITFYPFNTNGNKGIACGLNNLMKLDDGENLGGRQSAANDFADYADML